MNDSNQKNQSVNNQGDIGQVSDQVGGDKITIGDITDSVVAIGARAQVNITKLYSQGHSQDLRNRQQLIDRVKATWIQGVLVQALHKSVWIELGLKLIPEQVNRPLNITWESDTEQQIVPLFRKQAANTLLILGEPGSGKTITLLDLAQRLLDEAESELVAPIPVVFNLSSWALKRQPLHEWLLAELDTMYFVPRKTGRRWLEHDALILLLDGLDEVAEVHRPACVEAINTFREEHGLTGIAVCSRIEEYEALAERLNLLGAVVIKPLTAAQADDYLQKMGKQLESVRTLLKEDVVLQRWVRSPLFLYVVAMAYRGLSEEQLSSIHTGSLHQLYDAYVTQMLEHHRPYQQAPYTPRQTRRWLAYLAGRLTARELTEYLIEDMQPDWLEPIGSRLENKSIMMRWLRWVVGKHEIETFDNQWSWSALASFFRNPEVSWVVLGLVLSYGLVGGLFGGLAFGVTLALIVVMGSVLIGGANGTNPINYEKPNQGVWRSLVSVLTYVSIIGLTAGLIVGQADKIIIRLADGGLFFNLLFGLAFFIFGGPLIAMPGLMLMVTALGLIDFARHFSLRKVQAHYDYLPWHLVPFLEYARERLLLRRVGGGYIFIHRTLQEYFATQDTSFGQQTSQSASNLTEVEGP